MSTDKGYIKLYRDVRDHKLWNDKPFARGQAWIDLIMMVNHKDTQALFDGRFVPVYRGMCITSIRHLSDRWGWSQGKVSRFLNELEAQCMIRQERSAKRSTISIVNYDVYQESRSTKRSTDGALTEHRRSTDGDKQYTNKDTKEEMKKKYSPPDEVGNPWDEEGWE